MSIFTKCIEYDNFQCELINAMTSLSLFPRIMNL